VARLLAAVAAPEGCAAIHDNPFLLNDALLAESCRNAGSRWSRRIATSTQNEVVDKPTSGGAY
jgi:hypothetical protein